MSAFVWPPLFDRTPSSWAPPPAALSLAAEVHLATALLGDGREREGNPPNILGNALQREYQRAVGAIRANGFAVDAAELLGCAAGIFFGVEKIVAAFVRGGRSVDWAPAI